MGERPFLAQVILHLRNRSALDIVKSLIYLIKNLIFFHLQIYRKVLAILFYLIVIFLYFLSATSFIEEKRVDDLRAMAIYIFLLLWNIVIFQNSLL
jgi:hypothetical protein